MSKFFSMIPFLEWMEGEPARARRFLLIFTLIPYILITFSILVLMYFKIDVSPFYSYYLTFSAIVTAVVGFYTSTNAKTDAVEQTISSSKDSVQIKQLGNSIPTAQSK